jgi:cell fate regulator YaaT (PSP1 superfamily)
MSGCTTCNTTDSGVKGCKNNGVCGTSGCNKLNSFNWLTDMELPLETRFDVVEIRFKNGKKEFFRNINKFDLNNGDPVIVDVPNGHHLGYVALQGELVRLQMIRKNVTNDDQIKSIYRIANDKDLSKFEEVVQKEQPMLHRTREIISEQKLNMKLTDVEYQADGTKATFYYSADDRVDFRELIKRLASEFKVRVEMRQISLRQEASRLGGIGSCGRELCCSTWLTEFKSVTTTAARYQNLSLNPSKLSGQCGRLKCCLNYELDTYMDALKDIPEITKPISTQKGEAKLQKTDIFKRIMWFGYENENSWISIPISRVKEILKLNESGTKPATLKEDAIAPKDEVSEALNSDLELLDKKFQKTGKKKKRKKNNRQNWNKNKKPNQ